jgi:hypothetical protein
MMGLLLPAINNVRNQAQAKVCQNNIYQLSHALGRASGAKKKFPAPGQWAFEALPYMEQVPLYQLMKQNREIDPKFSRPPLLRCPMQDDVPSRVETVGFCHYALVINRYPNGDMERGWELQDVPLPESDVDPEPWYEAPEISYEQRAVVFAEKRGPHSDLFMTAGGLQPNVP